MLAQPAPAGATGSVGATGPAGAQGPAGTGATASSLEPGDPNCANGGASITDGNNNAQRRRTQDVVRDEGGLVQPAPHRWERHADRGGQAGVRDRAGRAMRTWRAAAARAFFSSLLPQSYCPRPEAAPYALGACCLSRGSPGFATRSDISTLRCPRVPGPGDRPRLVRAPPRRVLREDAPGRAGLQGCLVRGVLVARKGPDAVTPVAVLARQAPPSPGADDPAGA
jgi:hypothetical protein